MTRDGGMGAGAGVFPKALGAAVLANGDDPKWIGEILVCLFGGRRQGLDRAQRTVVALCEQEIESRLSKREGERVRKARSRAAKSGKGAAE